MAVEKKTPQTLLINGLPTDSGSLKAQQLTGLEFIGEASTPPLYANFICMGSEWLVDKNRLYYSPPFTPLNLSGGEHYEDDSIRPITFKHLINAVSVSPNGLTCKWALYVSTVEAVYELRFSGDKLQVQRLINAPALGSIGVGFLTRGMGEEIPSGTQIVVIPTAKGIFIATEGGMTQLNPSHPNVLEDFDYVHIALKAGAYGQYLVFLDALKK